MLRYGNSWSCFYHLSVRAGMGGYGEKKETVSRVAVELRIRISTFKTMTTLTSRQVTNIPDSPLETPFIS
jgi:hypothetical protein